MSEIKPALTPEEWSAVPPVVHHAFAANGQVVFVGERYGEGKPGAPGIVVRPETERHALAALALYGQRFGFTREDAMLVEHVGHYGGNIDWTLTDAQLDQLLSIAQRLAALLPPERTHLLPDEVAKIESYLRDKYKEPK